MGSQELWPRRWWRSETQGGQYQDDLTGTSFGMHNRGQFTLNIPTVARLELTVGGRGTMKITSGTIPSNYGADLGIEKSFMENRLSVTLKVNDLFNNRKFSINTSRDFELYTQEMYAERKRGRRTASINLKYNFGKDNKPFVMLFTHHGYKTSEEFQAYPDKPRMTQGEAKEEASKLSGKPGKMEDYEIMP